MTVPVLRKPTSGLPRTPSFEGLSSASLVVSKIKKATRSKETKPELLLRRCVSRLGLRYRKNVRALPGAPDLVFSFARVVVFCDGDFWHGNNWRRLRLQLKKRHNARYWIAKIRRNRERDRQQMHDLIEAGWKVVRLWESEIIKDPDGAAERILRIISKRSRISSEPRHAIGSAATRGFSHCLSFA